MYSSKRCQFAFLTQQAHFNQCHMVVHGLEVRAVWRVLKDLKPQEADLLLGRFRSVGWRIVLMMYDAVMVHVGVLLPYRVNEIPPQNL